MIGEDPIWTPAEEDLRDSNVARFQAHVRDRLGVDLLTYEALWQWSVDELELFWQAIWDFYGMASRTPHAAALENRSMPGARWFAGAEVNYAREVLGRSRPDGPALVAYEEDGGRRELTTEELRGQVGAFAAALRQQGVGPGDRVAACLPNVPEAVIAMLATTSLGAVWSVCAPEFGSQSIIDRFAQLEPTVLVAAAGYGFGGRRHDRRPVVAELQAALPTLRATVLVGGDAADAEALGALAFEPLVATPCEPRFADVPFDHPLWILFSSGTTGMPKGIVHGHGGIVLEHLKSLGLGMDLGPSDRYFFHSSTSWMAWNYLVGGLLHGSTVIAYNGSPGYPEIDALWTLAAESGATVLGMGAAYAASCQKAGVALGDELADLRTVVPTGSPLAPVGWSWLAEQLPPTTRVDAICGGTDVCTAFFGGSPLLPVTAGEISCRWLGIAAQAWDPEGRPVQDELGEFVVTEPMPSMPLALWDDADGARYRESYFDLFPGVWRQGDWISISEHGSVVVAGRSDATLNRHGVRMGSAEIYGAVERLPEVSDSLVVGVELDGGGYYMPLFVVPAGTGDLDPAGRDAILSAIRSQLSPRHVPDEIVVAPSIPRTLTGKKLELPVKRILQGASAERAASLGAVDDPDALRWFETFARTRAAPGAR